MHCILYNLEHKFTANYSLLLNFVPLVCLAQGHSLIKLVFHERLVVCWVSEARCIYKLNVNDFQACSFYDDLIRIMVIYISVSLMVFQYFWIFDIWSK